MVSGRHAVVPAAEPEPGGQGSARRLVISVEDLEDLVEERQVAAAEPCVRPRNVDPAIPGDVVDHVSAAERLEGAVDAIRIEVVECRRIEKVDLRPVDASSDVANAEIDAADPGQHPGFVGRIETAIVIYHDIVGGEEVRVAYVDVVVGIEPQHTLQALAEVVLFHEAPGPMVAGDEEVDELGMETIPAREDVVALLNLAREPLMVHRAQINGPDSIALVIVQQRVEIRRVGDIYRGQGRNLPFRIAGNGRLEISKENIGDRTAVGPLTLMRRAVSVQRRTDGCVIRIQESPCTFVQCLQVRADDELRLRKLSAAEIPNGLQEIDPKQGLTTLELDLDIRTVQAAEERKDAVKGLDRPVEATSRLGNPGDLAVTASKIAPKRRHEDDVVHSRRPRLPPRPPVGERCPGEIELPIETVIAFPEKAFVDGSQATGGVAIQEAVARLEKSACIVAEQYRTVRHVAELQRPDVHDVVTAATSAWRIVRVSV
ncbi:hypothetical protein MPL3356_110179 [Mesorhizobium plurifarium]|uniref:Uncharacterized protein n=1 Tax=Mesorhizobium plurifarium TaxID=69974 RepID=A0A090DFH2_MESPL|nr:hypothetical protein MPL3356_110179 [Mesorhizobium plurifarium]